MVFYTVSCMIRKYHANVKLSLINGVVKNSKVQKMQMAEMKMLRRMCGHIY